MKMNDKGLSLVEIVIVVAIMTVLSGIMTVGLSSVFSKPADECAKKIVSVMANTKVTTMGKKSISIDISQADVGAPIMITENVTKADGTTKTNDSYKVGERGITFTFTTVGGTEYDLSDVTKLSLSYNRQTGGLYQAKYKVKTSSTEEEKYVEEIKISKGTKTCVIKLYYLTGKVELQ